MSSDQKSQGNLPALKTLVGSDLVKEKLKGLVDVDTFTTSLVSIVGENQVLKNCDANTVVQSAMKAAALRLPIDKTLGKAYIVPYGKSATFILGYKGLIELAARSGKYETINATEVYEDEFDHYDYFTGEIVMSHNVPVNGLRHKAGSKPTGYYAYFKLMSGFRKSIYMTREAVEEHGKHFSKSFDNGPWKDHFDTMAIKTVVKKLLGTYGVLDTATQKALAEDNKAEIIDAHTGEVVSAPDESKRVSTQQENPI